MKRDYYYASVFLTPEGQVWVDYSLRNKEGKVIFKRTEANKIEKHSKTNDWDIKNEIKKINFYLEKNGLEIMDIPIPMTNAIRRESKNLIVHDRFYFATVRKVRDFVRNDNFVLMDFEDLINDEEIFDIDKMALTFFFNGDAIPLD